MYFEDVFELFWNMCVYWNKKMRNGKWRLYVQFSRSELRSEPFLFIFGFGPGPVLGIKNADMRVIH